ALEVRLQLIPALDAQGVLMKDVLVHRVHRRRPDGGEIGKRARVIRRVLASRRRPRRKVRQLREQDGRLERVEARVGAHLVVVVLLRAAVEAELPEALRKGVLRRDDRSEEHTSELQSRGHLVCRLLLEKKKKKQQKVKTSEHYKE